VSFFSAAVRADDVQQKEVMDLLQCVEFKGLEQQRLDKLEKQSVLIPALLLEQNYPGLDNARVIATLARQYQRHLNLLSEPERQQVLNLVVKKSRGLNGIPLLQVLLSFKGINSEVVRDFAFEFENNPDEYVQKAARSLIESMGRKNSSSAALPADHGVIAPAPQPLPDPATREAFSPVLSGKPALVWWSVAVAVLTLGLWLLIKKRK
jgi:hypothetical protein